MDEDLNTVEDEQMDKGNAGGKTVPGKQRGAAVKRKETDKENEKVEEEMKKKRRRRSAGESVKAR